MLVRGAEGSAMGITGAAGRSLGHVITSRLWEISCRFLSAATAHPEDLPMQPALEAPTELTVHAQSPYECSDLCGY